MSYYTLLARLLEYPSADLVFHLDALRDHIVMMRDLGAEEREELLKVVSWLENEELITVQSHYVDTFDLVPEHSLHLTHHTYGDSRERGPALVELDERYRAAGLERTPQELPDYLPLILEFIGLCDEEQVREFLCELAILLAPVAESLEKAQSHYAPIIRLIETRGRLARTAA